MLLLFLSVVVAPPSVKKDRFLFLEGLDLGVEGLKKKSAATVPLEPSSKLATLPLLVEGAADLSLFTAKESVKS